MELLSPPSGSKSNYTNTVEANEAMGSTILLFAVAIAPCESLHRLQIQKLQHTAKYREVYLAVIGLISVVLTHLARA